MRLFVAVVPPAEARRAAQEAGRALGGSRPSVAWVRGANLHFTLRFLGEQPDDARGAIGDAMREAAAATPCFAARFSACGAFPDARRARVLWLGVGEGGEALHGLAAALERALVARGFAAAAQPFAAHLTLGRARVPGDWSAALRAAEVPAAPFEVSRLELIRSTLAAGGSRYETILEAPLAAPGVTREG